MFSPHIGETFQVNVGLEQPIPLQLVAADAMNERYYHLEGTRTPFSLVFAGPPNLRLPQQTYMVEHDTLGTFPLFLVPIKPEKDSSRYEAVFN
jgi:hypothetical protein